MVYIILEAFVLALLLSLDSFAAGFAYGANKIKIPFSSVQIISFICSGMVGISLIIGSVIKNWIPPFVTTGICFLILFIMGIVKLTDGLLKSWIRKSKNAKRNIEFSLLNIHFILSLYANPEESDIDKSKTISPMEAASLSLALSLDGLAVGFGAAMGNVNGLALFICSLVTNTLFILLGCTIGQKLAHRLQIDLSWISGAFLIIMAFIKLF